jgi:ribosomal protein S18 acetylase RimI-like enzyme
MKIVDLREVHARALEGLFDEQARFWRDVFLWDYRPALDMIRRFVGTRSLEGYAVMEGDEAVAYGFYVLEDRKGLIGDFFVSPRFSQRDVACPLLTRILASLQSVPWISRIETHIMPLETDMLQFLAQRDFSLYERQFMRLDLAQKLATPGTGASDGTPRDAPDAPKLEPTVKSGAFVVERWNDHDANGVARLIELAYATHVDSQINDQYSSEAGAHHFLRNITQTLACGEFLRDASFVLRPRGESQPTGVVLTSRVDDGVAHITQICVMPGYQRNGIGRILMDASVGALQARRYRSLTLTVTSANQTAVRLYEILGFHTLRKFCAGVWRV